MDDADNRRLQVDVGIEALVQEMAPSALCDACLAFALEVPLDDIYAAIPRLLRGSLRFTRKSLECSCCLRVIELLVMR